ncbi:MAG TPA: hypothetical protein DCS60_08745 [Opitutae bacterium]|nr:hypothetical protein [Opitutae bacterium]
MFNLPRVEWDGTYIAQWPHFGMPSWVFFVKRGKIDVSDPELNYVHNPGLEICIRIIDINTDWVDYFILLPTGAPRLTKGNGRSLLTSMRPEVFMEASPAGGNFRSTSGWGSEIWITVNIPIIEDL